MRQAELVRRLDTFFGIEAFDESATWRTMFTDSAYRTFTSFATPSFLEGTWNGLMLDNTEQVEQVYLATYPTQDVLDTIIAREVASGAQGALIFAHHLAAYDESRTGRVHIQEEQLEELAEHGISFYVCHAPLDVHPEISTGVALANLLGLREQARFSEYFGSKAGVYGLVNKPLGFQTFATRLAKVTDVDVLRYDQVRHDGLPVNRVAVVPGRGGGTPELMQQAIQLACDTFVTGYWWFAAENDAASLRREEMRDFLADVRLNILAVSPYATEMVVMRDQMPGWFRELGLDVEFVPQENPWR